MLDLSSDQKTVFYTSRDGTPASERQVHRFDVSTSTNLADFANLGGTQRTADLKLLPPGDGSGGLVATTTEIKRIDGSGQVMRDLRRGRRRTRGSGSPLIQDGKSFWAQTNNTAGNVFRFNIATGVRDRGPLPSAGSAFGICGEEGTKTAAIDNAAPSVTISTPADGASFTPPGRDSRSRRHSPAPTGTRNGTGIESCSGPVANGSPIDTSSVRPQVLHRPGTRPRGQHRLTNHELHRRLTAASAAPATSSADPGRGTISFELAKKPTRV